MSVRHSLLALLTEGPRYGYQLRQTFEERTGSLWPLNVGQVYTTLDRLERDGLVADHGHDDEGHRIFMITPAGREEAERWFTEPYAPTAMPRNELAIKIAVAVATPGVDVRALLAAQRASTLTRLQGLTRSRRTRAAHAGPEDLAALLVIESGIVAAEAEVRWLDHCESAVLRALAQRRPTPAPLGRNP